MNVNATLTTYTYENYLSDYVSKAAYTDKTVQIDAGKPANQADCSTSADYKGKKGSILLTKDDSTATWNVNVPVTGRYAIKLNYYPMTGTGNKIQRTLLIDNKMPFDEAEFIEFTRVYKNNTAIEHLKNENDVRPTQVEDPQWMDTYIQDSNSFFGTKLYFYFTAGNHQITLKSKSEPMAISSITLESVADNTPDYNTYYSNYKSQGAKVVSGALSGGIEKIQAEDAALKSDQTLYPVADNSSGGNEPYDTQYEKINSIGGTKWENPRQWITWDVSVPESGFYQIGFRYLQNSEGVNAIRSIYVDGTLPFKEAASLSYSYNTKWQTMYAGGKTPYLFYFEKGSHVLKMEVTLGQMSNVIMRATNAIKALDTTNWELLTLFGASPDTGRDYDVPDNLPDVIPAMNKQITNFQNIVKDWISITGRRDSNTAQITQLIYVMQKMTSNTDTIASMYSLFRDDLTNVGNTLSLAKQEPLKFDYLFLAEQGTKLPKANPNVAQRFYVAFMKFWNSFFTDYNNLSGTVNGKNKKSITVWIGSGLTGGRDQANVLTQLIKQEYTGTTGINVNLQLVPAGTLLTATIAGKAPDVALQNGSTDPANFAMRHAVVDLSKLSGYSTMIKQYDPSSLTMFQYMGGLYAIPENFTFPVMFYRKDVLARLGIDINSIKTWDDLIAILPIIEKKNMEIGLGANSNSYYVFLYQNGGTLYKNNDTESNLDSKVALDSFNYFMSLYNNYGLPYTYSFATRFRTGEMPIAIDDLTQYNTIQISDPEITGQWGFVPIPGTRQSDGSINNVAPVYEGASTCGCMIMNSTKDLDSSWSFVKWWTSTSVQYQFGRELESVLGVGARYNTANNAAINLIPWTTSEKQTIFQTMKNLKGIPQVPGGYLTSRNINFAIATTYSSKTDARETLESYVPEITQEIEIKRKEFGLK